MSRFANVVSFVVVLAGTTAGLGLCAKAARADDARAREAFAKGIELYDRKDFPAALRAFQQAYAEKPSPGIKQNIALTYEAMGDKPQAAAAFDAALEEGRGSLSDKTRAAIDQKLAALSVQVATVHMKVLAEDSRLPVAGATVSYVGSGDVETTVDGAALERPLRLAPGIYTFHAHAPGFAPPPTRRLALTAGLPVDATFELSRSGTVTLRPSVETAEVLVDGVVVGRGTWTGKLAPGAHRVEARAPGFQPATATVIATAGASVDYPVTLRRSGELPEYYPTPPLQKPPAPPYKRWYVAVFGAVDGVTLRLSPALGEDHEGRRRTITGGSFGVHGGYRFSRFFGAELYADMGFSNATYTGGVTDTIETKTHVDHWQILPAVRFTSAGKVRLTTGAGVGLHHLSIRSALHQAPGTVDVRGSGTSLSWLFDIGMALDVGPIWFEGLLFANVADVKPVRDDLGRRLALDSPATRIGFRLGIGVPF